MLSDRLVLTLSLVVVDLVGRIEDILRAGRRESTATLMRSRSPDSDREVPPRECACVAGCGTLIPPTDRVINSTQNVIMSDAARIMA